MSNFSSECAHLKDGLIDNRKFVGRPHVHVVLATWKEGTVGDKPGCSCFDNCFISFPMLPCFNAATFTGSFCNTYIHVLMRDEKEGRKKQARSKKQQGKATQLTQGSEMSCLEWDVQ